MSGDLVYGRRAVREALRGRREVLEVLATERAVAAEPWLAEATPRLRPDRELSELADTRDHQGVVARVEPFRYADAWELAAVDRPLLVVLDRITDPRNLGAVCRSAEGAGATGWSSRRTVRPSSLRQSHAPRPARSSTCRSQSSRTSRATSSEVKGPSLWVYGAAGEAEASMWNTDLTGGVALVFGAEGKGLRPLVRRSCDALVSIPSAGVVESLNVSVAAAVLLYEARRQRGAGG